jgi:hypothetical protein
MNCAQRICVYALVGLSCIATVKAVAKDADSVDETNSPDRFQWHDHTKLSWDDFKGAVNATHDESAAATYCSIGFKTAATTPGGKPEIVVYNSFYINKSWVRSDARIQSILDHEQGHFDLCEIYTRKLKERMNNFNFDIPNVKQALISIYTELNKEYELRQQAYEQETVHGTNIMEQKKWQVVIASELNS